MAIDKPEHITDISRNIREKGTSEIADLSAIVVPVVLPLFADIHYKCGRVASGARMSVEINGRRVLGLEFKDEKCERSAQADISEHVNNQINELRCRCFVSSGVFSDEPDEGLLVIRGPTSTIIKKKFTTRGPAEPYDMCWNLIRVG